MLFVPEYKWLLGVPLTEKSAKRRSALVVVPVALKKSWHKCYKDSILLD
jgi:hypothetical protein